MAARETTSEALERASAALSNVRTRLERERGEARREAREIGARLDTLISTVEDALEDGDDG